MDCKRQQITRCDAHLHYGLRAPVQKIAENSVLRRQYPCYGTVQFEPMEDYERQLSLHELKKTVLVPFVFREQKIREENLLVLDFARKDPEHRFPYAYLDEEAPEFISRYRGELVGVKEHIVRNQSVMTDAKRVIFEQLRDYGMTLLLHSERVRRVGYVRSILKEFPGIKIQIAHMGRGLPGDTAMIYEMLRTFAGDETVTFDTSTTRDPLVIEKAVQLVGAERILYGSDFPFYSENKEEDIMEEQILQIMRANITDHQREKIFSENFEHWVKKGRV